MKKILLSGQNKHWGNLEETTEFWLSLGINHVMIKVTEDTRYIENGRVAEKEFERFQALQEKYGVKYHLHPYDIKTDRGLLDLSLKKNHPIFKEILIKLDEKILQHNLYPLITLHLPKFSDARYNLKVSEQMALQNGKDFFQSLNLKSKIALETMHNPHRNVNESSTALLGYKAEHFRKIIGTKNYGLCVDVGHLNMAEESLEKFLELPCPIFSVHLHGNNGMRDEHKMADKNNVKNFELVRKMLKKVNGPVVLEVRNYDYSLRDFEYLFELWELNQ